MHILIGILGVAQILGGMVAYNVAVSAMHEIFFAVLFGSGSICLGLAAIISRLTPLVNSSQTAATSNTRTSFSDPDRGREIHINTHKGCRIIRSASGAVMVNGIEFSGIAAAERHIDKITEG